MTSGAPGRRKVLGGSRVAVSAALMRTSAGWSDVATTDHRALDGRAEVAVDELLDLAATLADEAK